MPNGVKVTSMKKVEVKSPYSDSGTAKDLSCNSLAQNQGLKPAMGKAAEMEPAIPSLFDLHNVDIVTPERPRKISNNYDFFSINIFKLL